MPEATPAFSERVEPCWVMWTTGSHAARVDAVGQADQHRHRGDIAGEIHAADPAGIGGGEGGNALPTGGKVRPPAENGKIAPFLRVRRHRR